MSDLNVALILRLVDRLSVPARVAAKSLGLVAVSQREVAKGAGTAGAAVDRTAKQTAGLARVAELAAKGSGRLTSAFQGEARAAAEAERASDGLSRAQDRGSRSTASLSGTLTAATRRLGTFEQMQLRGRAASRMLGGELDRLDGKLGTLAKGAIVTGAMQSAGRSILGPIGAAVTRQAAFARTMTGVKITSGLSAADMKEVRANVFHTASALGQPLDRVIGVHGAVVNEGGYRSAGDIGIASRSASELQLLAEAGGDPVSDQEAGAMTNAYAYGLGISAKQIDRFNSMMFKSTNLGGTRLGTVMRNLPGMMGRMKAFGFGNETGFADALTAFQVVKRTAGDDNQAAIFTQDLMQNIGHQHTIRQFAKRGVNLTAALAAGEAAGKSPLQVVAEQANGIIAKLHSNAEKATTLTQLTGNVQAGGALMAILQNWKDGPQGVGFVSMRRQTRMAAGGAEYHQAVHEVTSDDQAQLNRLAVAQDSLAIETGKVLAPATQRLAGAMAGLNGWLAKVEARGGGLRIASSGVIGFAARATPAMLAFSAALLTNPITWIVAGVVGLAAAAFLIWKNWRPISAFFVRMWGGVKESFGSALGWIGGLAGRFAGMGASLMGGLARGVLGALGAVKGAIAHAASSVVQWFKDRLGIKSPSRVFASLGHYSMQGLAVGLTAGIPHAGSAARLAAGRIALAAAAGLMAPNIASAAAAHAAPPAFEPVHSSVTTTKRAAGGDLIIHNTFHVTPPPGTDVRELARELARLEGEARRKALHDGGGE